MSKEKVKVYLYTRVSTSMQIDGYSLDAQKSRMKAFCDFNDYEIAGEYEDAGKSGKSIEGRTAFNSMMEDIKTGKDDVSFVLVFKLSRFGRNAADVLNSLQTMQDFGVNLICVEDGIDSSKEAGSCQRWHLPSTPANNSRPCPFFPARAGNRRWAYGWPSATAVRHAIPFR